MISSRLFRRERESDISSALYGAIVALARDPVLYRDFRVADTVDGRFESLVLHLVLVLRRLRAGDTKTREVGQNVFDQFCQEMDRSLREMGVGDVAVSKRMRKVGEIYYGRSDAYNTALSAQDGARLATALQRSIPSAESTKLAVDGLAAYITATDAALAGVPDGAILGNEIPRLDPAKFVAPETEDDDKPEPHRAD